MTIAEALALRDGDLIVTKGAAPVTYEVGGKIGKSIVYKSMSRPGFMVIRCRRPGQDRASSRIVYNDRVQLVNPYSDLEIGPDHES